MSEQRFSIKDYEKELILELKFRRKVWQRIPGTEENFRDLTQEKRYLILKELLEILESAPIREWERLVNYSKSAKQIIQTSMFQDEI